MPLHVDDINWKVSYRDQNCFRTMLKHVISAVKLAILHGGLIEIASFRTQPQMAARVTAVFGTSTLALMHNPGGCCLEMIQR